MNHRARTSHCSRAQTHASARARARMLSARRSLSHAPHSCRSSLSAQRLCAGFHASPDSLMGAARSRHLILSAHTWARAAFAGTGLPLPACVVPLPQALGAPPGALQPVFDSLLCSGPVARSVITRRRAYSGARYSPRPVRPSRADGLPSLGADTLSGPIELVKPMLFVCKVPMVYGTIISGIIVFGAVVFVSAMLSGSGPSPSSMASAAALFLPSPPPLHGRGEAPVPTSQFVPHIVLASVTVQRALARARCLVTCPHAGNACR